MFILNLLLISNRKKKKQHSSQSYTLYITIIIKIDNRAKKKVEILPRDYQGIVFLKANMRTIVVTECVWNLLECQYSVRISRFSFDLNSSGRIECVVIGSTAKCQHAGNATLLVHNNSIISACVYDKQISTVR